MAFNKDNSGSLSKNTRKEKETHPDIKGKATIDGVEYWVDGWAKDGENGKWYSLSFKRKDAATAKPAGPAKAVDPNEDIPFLIDATLHADESPLAKRMRRGAR